MPRPRPLTPTEATRTLANRFGKRADSLRQFNTKFGVRSKRVFLVWTQVTGEERGEGDENIFARVELLPTPRVSELTAVSRMPFIEGSMPNGGIRIDEISVHRYTEDMLRGLVIPGEPGAPGRPIAAKGSERLTDRRIDFFYEVVDDGRQGEGIAARQRFQLIGYPARLESRVQFAVFLQRASADMLRDGKSTADEDDL